jgi:hypothetical protein
MQETPAVPTQYPFRPAILTTCLAAAVLFLRRPISFLHPQFFAEDAAVFFSGAERSPIASIFKPYAGYLHVGLRLVAALASPLDARWTPAAYFAASFLAFVGLELALFSPRIGLPKPWILGLGVVMVPHSGEVFDTLTNVQWITGLGLVLLVLARDPQGNAERSLDLGYAAVASLTGVFSIVFAPLFAARAAKRRTADAVWLALIVISGAVVQTYEILVSQPPHVSALPSLSSVVSTFGGRVWLSLLVTPAASDAAALWIRISAATVGFVLLIPLIFGLREGQCKRAALGAALLFIFAAVIYKFRDMLDALASVRAGDRYFYVPKVCILWILTFHLGAASKFRWPARALMTLILINSCLEFRFERWDNYNWPYWAKRIREEDRVVVPINPVGFKYTHEKPRCSGTP